MPKLRRYLSWVILGICTAILIVACDRGAYLQDNRTPDIPKSDRPTSTNSDSVFAVGVNRDRSQTNWRSP